MSQINKQELVSEIAEKTGFTKKDVFETVEALIETITKQLADGNEVTLAGLGKFVVRDRKARTGKNPATGEEIEIPETKTAAFVAAKALKDAVKD